MFLFGRLVLPMRHVISCLAGMLTLVGGTISSGNENNMRTGNAYFARYQGVEAFMAKILADCAANGYVKTILGRRRSIRGIRSSLDRERARRQRNLSERTAINTVIQGSAADLIKLAMLKIHRCLSQESLPARLLLQIHDELVFEAATPQLPSLAALVSREMMNVLPFEVPLKVDLSRGPNLAELRAI